MITHEWLAAGILMGAGFVCGWWLRMIRLNHIWKNKTVGQARVFCAITMNVARKREERLAAGRQHMTTLRQRLWLWAAAVALWVSKRTLRLSIWARRHTPEDPIL